MERSKKSSGGGEEKNQEGELSGRLDGGHLLEEGVGAVASDAKGPGKMGQPSE